MSLYGSRSGKFSYKKVTALDLLYRFIELRQMVSDLSCWKNEYFTGSSGADQRYHQLLAMFKAYQIPWNPEEFISGTFIDFRSSRYEALFEKMTSEFYGSRRSRTQIDKSQLQKCFCILLKYRQQLETTLNYASGVLTASGLYGYAYKKTLDFNEIILEKVGFIDNILAELISPEGKEFWTDQLARDYGYPAVCVYSSDMDDW